MIKDINEIGLEYAEEHGGGLPLSAKEFCNALALWVQKNCVLKNEQGETMTVNELEKLLQGSDSITLYNNGQKIEFSLNAELVRDVSKSLKFPVSNPTETELVGVDELGQQVMIPQSQVGRQYYRHLFNFDFGEAKFGYVSFVDAVPKYDETSFRNALLKYSSLIISGMFGSSLGVATTSVITSVGNTETGVYTTITPLGYTSLRVYSFTDTPIAL